MEENNHEEEPRERCKEALFVDDKSAKLIQRVTSVMAIADELRTKDIIHGEKYEEIKAEKTNQEKMRRLFESLNSGGDDVKRVFYHFLEKHEPYLFKSLGGINRKRKQDEHFDDTVPSKRLNTGSNDHYTHNYNKASTSAAEPVPAYTVNYIINQNEPPNNMDNVASKKNIDMTSWAHAPSKEKKHPASVQKKPCSSKKVNKPPKKEKKSPAAKREKPPAPKKEKKPPAPKKEKKPPAPKKEKKPPAPKKEKKPPAQKTENKAPAPKKDKPPAPKKEKKPAAPKKENKPPTSKKNKPPAPKKEKKPPAPKKEKKPPAPKKQKPSAPKIQKPPAPKKQKPSAPKKVKKAPAHK